MSELAYVIITPYSLHKSRTGGIFARLITRTGLDLVGARMFAPSQELVKEYAEATVSSDVPQDRQDRSHAKFGMLDLRARDDHASSPPSGGSLSFTNSPASSSEIALWASF